MRLSLLGLALVSSAAFAQTPAKPAPPPAPAPAPAAKKPPSRLTKVVKKLADTAATAVAGMAADTLLGAKGRAVANALTGNTPGATGCPAGTIAVPVNQAGALGLAGGHPSAGAALVGAAKSALKTKAAAAAGAVTGSLPVETGQAGGIACHPMAAGGVPGAAGLGYPGVPGAAPGMPPGMGGMSALAAVTPVGMAVAAAPLAGQAVKGLKGMFGGKPMDKIAMLRELGKGRLELKGVKFIEGTAEMEPGFEPSFAALGEALPLAEGTYLVHIAAEQGDKETPPDTALARKRLEKVWAAMLVNGVSDQKIIAAPALPAALQEGRKPPKRGAARVEVIRLPAQQ